MKKDQKAVQAFKKLEAQLVPIKEQIKSGKKKTLWHAETALRTRVRVLRGAAYQVMPDYKRVYDAYMDAFDDVSRKILAQYNAQHDTDYDFDSISRESYQAYVSSGILSVLLTDHIPRLAAEEFNRLLPDDPKDEYPLARALKRTFYLHLGETNTGKTYEAIQRLKNCRKGVYLAPLRILALENYERLNNDGVLCSLTTGDEEILLEGAGHTSCTVEKLDVERQYDVAVLDEVQLMGDIRRGDAWTRAILGLNCTEIHLCGAMTAKEQLLRMIADCGDEAVVQEYTRSVPLKVEKRPVRLSKVQRGDALVAFSKKNVLSMSRYLNTQGIKNSVIYGDLPPEVRRMQYAAFLSGETQVLVTTDAIGLGVNLPIRRIVFTQTTKYDGENVRPLTSQEVKQIAGRAGRLGIYDVGYVACMGDDIDFIDAQLNAEDDEITQAMVGPTETITEITLLPLKEKLALWSARGEKLPYYAQKDVRDYLLVLDHIKSYHLPESVQWRLMKIPFDVNREALLALFMRYMDECFIQKRPVLSVPLLSVRSLPGCEEYYQKLGLYYSFSKNMNLYFDADFVSSERRAVSERMNMLLLKSRT